MWVVDQEPLVHVEVTVVDVLQASESHMFVLQLKVTVPPVVS